MVYKLQKYDAIIIGRYIQADSYAYQTCTKMVHLNACYYIIKELLSDFLE